MRINNLCSEDTDKGMEKLATDWEEISAKSISDGGFVIRLYKQLSKLNKKKTKQLN